MSTFDSTGARRRRRQIDVFARGHGARVHDARLRVGPHDDGHRRRRRAARRPARPRTGGRRRGRLLLRRPALLPAHVALPTSSAAAITFRRRELPGKTSKIAEPLAALAPLEVAARRRVDPGRLVALAAHIFILLRDDGAAASDRRHRGWRRGRYGFLAGDGLLRGSLTTDHDRDGRIPLSRRRRPRHRWSSTSIGRGLPPAHHAMSSPSRFGPWIIHESVIRGSFAPQDPIQRWNVTHLYRRRNGTRDR